MNNKIIKNIIPICLLLILGCSRSEKKDVTLSFWAMGAEGEQVQKLIPEFERRNPGIRVNVQMVPWTAAQEKLISSYASDNTPDLCQLGNTWVPQFSAINAIVDLDEWIKKSSNVKKENYFEGIWETNVINGRVYGISWYIDTRVMFYRTDVFKEAGYDHPPRTWDELYDLSKKIKAIVGKDKFAVYLPTDEWSTFIIFGLQNGSAILKQNNSYGDFSGEKYKEAFEYLIRFHRENLTPAGMRQVTNVYQALAEKYLSIYISGPWNINEFKKWMTGDLKDKWMTAPLPGKNEYPGKSTAGGSSLVMFRASKHKEEVWKLIEYLSEPEVQIKFYGLLYNLPAVKEAWKDTSIANNKYMKAFYEQFQNVAPTPKIPEWEQIAFSKVQQYAEAAARGSMSIDAALNALDHDVNIILEKRRWLLSHSSNE
ncbi:MAG: sugar ABC transporter substrate-binding protein [Syntrophothermus sp.]